MCIFSVHEYGKMVFGLLVGNFLVNDVCYILPSFIVKEEINLQQENELHVRINGKSFHILQYSSLIIHITTNNKQLIRLRCRKLIQRC